MTKQLRASNTHGVWSPAPSQGSSRVPIITALVVQSLWAPWAPKSTFSYTSTHTYIHIHTNMYTYEHTCVHTHMNTGHCFVCCAGRGNQACFLNYIATLFKHFVLKWDLAMLPRLPSNSLSLPQLLG